MVEKIEGYSEAHKIFLEKRYEIVRGRLYDSVQSLLDFSEEITRKTLNASSVYNENCVALGVTDFIAARVEEPESVFKRMLAFFEENGITTNVQTDSLRYKSAVCLSIYLERKI